MKVGSDLGKDLVPGPADLLAQVAAQRSEVSVQILPPRAPALANPLPARQFAQFGPLLAAVSPFGSPPKATAVVGPLHDHFSHVGAHPSSVNDPRSPASSAGVEPALQL